MPGIITQPTMKNFKNSKEHFNYILRSKLCRSKTFGKVLVRSLMGNYIGLGVLFKSVCFDFFLHQCRQLSNWNPYFQVTISMTLPFNHLLRELSQITFAFFGIF